MTDRTEALMPRLVGATVASCTCLTKSPDPDFHDLNCRYRVLSEAMAELEAHSATEALKEDVIRAASDLLKNAITAPDEIRLSLLMVSGSPISEADNARAEASGDAAKRLHSLLAACPEYGDRK